MREKSYEPQSVFAPYMKHYGSTPEEQLEKNKPLMEWLKQKIEASKNLTEEEIERNRQYIEELKKNIDSFRPTGYKLYSEE